MTAPADKTIKANGEAIAQDMRAANQLAVATVERNERVSALARQLNYNGSTDPGTLENSARDAIRRIGMGIFELGAYLLLLREACPHGQFLPALERMGLDPDAGQRYMKVTRRFANAATSRHLESTGMSKLVELLPLDDEQVRDLTDLGQTGELALDDVARMSVKELRAAVRKERSARERLETVSKELNAELAETKQRFRLLPPDKVLLELQQGATKIANEAVGLVRGSLRQAVIAVRNHGDEDHTPFLAGLVGQLQADLAALREEFGLPDTSTAADRELAAEVAQWAGKR